MHKFNIVNVVAFAAGLCIAMPSYANEWQFTVTNDQNGPGWNCNEPASIPCSVTNKLAPYVLGTLTIDAPLASYEAEASVISPTKVGVDDTHLISFVASSARGLSVLNWPPPSPNYPLDVDVTVNEVNGALSGYIFFDLNAHGSAAIVMTGMGNLWTGYWITWDGPTHQFWARSDKIIATSQR